MRNRPAENMEIENARLRGKMFAVKITGNAYTVIYDGKQIEATIGETVTI